MGGTATANDDGSSGTAADGKSTLVTHPNIAADDGDPRVVRFERLPARQPDETMNKIEAHVDGTVEIVGTVTLSTPCNALEIVGIESTSSGDLVQMTTNRTSGICMTVVARGSFRLVLQYEGEPDDVSLEFVDSPGLLHTNCCA
ncbi:hypothetical protein [Natrinema sp. 74]|uniref:hypothetical protein n=1 Tax=Natrinema sp. 74 TaxID=3384159 RepID=UPI0038D4C2EF